MDVRPFGFSRHRRLTESGDFVRLLKHGRRRTLSGYVFYVGMRGDDECARLGILISRKHSKRATTRNYIKRCVREAFRFEQHALRGHDVLVRPPLSAIPSSDMITTMRALFARLKS